MLKLKKKQLESAKQSMPVEWYERVMAAADTENSHNVWIDDAKWQEIHDQLQIEAAPTDPVRESPCCGG
jgi:hypothetical protein